MQGKGKFEIEFEGKIKIKKEKPCSNRAYLHMNFTYVMLAICTHQVQLYYITFMFLIFPKCIHYVSKRKALHTAELIFYLIFGLNTLITSSQESVELSSINKS